MKLDEKITRDLASGVLQRIGNVLQGVSKDRIKAVLTRLSRDTPDQVDTVFALLDDRSSWFSKAASKGMKFCDGASTAHLACHVGIMQRGISKLDREGRDYWIKPLIDIGAIERITFDGKNREFFDGHIKSKSPNSSYRLSASFKDILQASLDEWEGILNEWSSQDATRARLQVQATLAEHARQAAGGGDHERLITAACRVYVERFLLGYEILYIDSKDGIRVDEDAKKKLSSAGLGFELSDSMPDILLYNPVLDSLWVVEAVCSDGEVDLQKVKNLTEFTKRYGKKAIGFTTAYRTWKDAAMRQGKHKNIAPGTYIWIEEDGTKQFTVETFKA